MRWMAGLALLMVLGCQQEPQEPEAAAASAAPADQVTLPEGAAIRLETATLSRQMLAETLEGFGQVGSRPDGESVVHAPVAGHVQQVRVQVGDSVVAGAVLASLVSPALGEAQADYLQARSNVELARRERERVKKLLGAELASQRELEAADQRLSSASVGLSQARERLRALGFGEGAVAALGARGRINPHIPLLAPQAGTVIDRHLAMGQFVAPDDPEPLFRLQDLRTVRVEAGFAERDFLKLKVGQPVRVTLEAMPGRSFQGKVSRLSPTLVTESRTGKAFLDVPKVGSEGPFYQRGKRHDEAETHPARAHSGRRAHRAGAGQK